MTAEDPRHRAVPLAGAETTVLTRDVAEAVRAVPGVVDVVPTLAGRAKHWGSAWLRQSLPVSGQGVEIRLTGTETTVTVDVAVSAAHRLRTTAEHVQEVVCSVLAGHGIVGASVTVSILAVRF